MIKRVKGVELEAQECESREQEIREKCNKLEMEKSKLNEEVIDIGVIIPIILDISL